MLKEGKRKRNDVLYFTFREEKERTVIQWNRIFQVLKAQICELEQ